MFSSAIGRLNERRDGTGDAGADAGFTLIELMVVLLILAISLAVSIPTFLGVTKSANDRAVQANLNTALTNAKALYQTQGQSYTSSSVTTVAAFVTAMSSAEPSLAFQTGGSTKQSQVSVNISTTDGNGLVLAALSASSNNCFLIVDNPAVPTAASTNGPWLGTTPTGTVDTTFTTASPAAGITVPDTTGTFYAEIKGATSTQCNASAPATLGSAGSPAQSYRWSSAGFPSI
jgi:type IV pilus assembly protein PilA